SSPGRRRRWPSGSGGSSRRDATCRSSVSPRTIRWGNCAGRLPASCRRSRTMPITLALEAYDRTQALLAGRVAVPGVRLVIVDSGPRHERMLLDRGYDAAELSMSSYILARARGAALTAIPVFPRRLFSPSCVYVRRGLTDPARLAGGRIGVYSLQ